MAKRKREDEDDENLEAVGRPDFKLLADTYPEFKPLYMQIETPFGFSSQRGALVFF